VGDSVATAVGAALAGLGVRQVFTLLGSGNFLVTEALRRGGCTVVSARHETAAVTMADAYARVTGAVGVVTLHQGPGLTNAATGIAEAAKSRTPLLVLAADTAGAAVRSNFRIDQTGLAVSLGAVAERLHSPASAVTDAVRAYRRAVVERRPVVLNLPLDVQAAQAPVADVPTLRLPAPPRPSAASVGAVADVLATAQRPVVIAGRGAARAGARQPLEDLADACGALVATSAVAAGLFAGSPWDLGISGGFASPVASELIASADVVLAFGASLTMWTTRHGRLLADDATVVQVDDDPSALGADPRVDLGVMGDAAETARDLVAELRRRDAAASSWRSEALRTRIGGGSWADTAYDDASDAEHIDPRTLTRELARILPADRNLAVDSGHFMGWAPMYLPVPDPQGFVFTQGFQSVGLGLATAIGAATARPDRLTVAALGDGGALMALGELETVVRLGLRLVVVVYDDAAYGAEVHHFGPEGHPVDLVQFRAVDFAAMGRAAAMDAATVRRPEDLTALDAWLRAGGRGAFLVDAKVVPTVVAEWLEEAFRGH
jgi:thiamine pyrophosphate-dependent acetolactate synthase large subunit-like protein